MKGEEGGKGGGRYIIAPYPSSCFNYADERTRFQSAGITPALRGKDNGTVLSNCGSWNNGLIR